MGLSMPSLRDRIGDRIDRIGQLRRAVGLVGYFVSPMKTTYTRSSRPKRVVTLALGIIMAVIFMVTGPTGAHGDDRSYIHFFDPGHELTFNNFAFLWLQRFSQSSTVPPGSNDAISESSPIPPIENCDEMVRAAAAGVDLAATLNLSDPYEWYGVCGVLSALGQARPARASFFAYDRLTQDLFQNMPATRTADGNALTMRDLAASSAAVSVGPRRIIVEIEGEISYWLELIAAADFDSDDIEDILVSLTQRSLGQGTYRASEVWIVSRLSPVGPLIVKGVELKPPPVQLLQPHAP